MTSAGPSRSGGQASTRLAGFADARGFTLIEVVAIMAIIGLTLAVALPVINKAGSRPQLDGVATAIATILDGDRRAAMRHHAEVSSVVDVKSRTVTSGAGGRSITLPDSVTITSVLARTCLGAAIKDRIVFLPGGLSCGGAIAIARAGETINIRVNWLTGSPEITVGRS